MTTVRYIVSDVAEAVDFYVSKLGFEVELQVPAFEFQQGAPEPSKPRG